MSATCCSVFQSQISMADDEIRRLARMAARRSQAGRDVQAILDQIATEKAIRAATQVEFDRHECSARAS